MASESKPTAEVNGVLWGSRVDDWAALQEGQCRPVFEEVLERLKVAPGTILLEAGCGAGMASQIAASRGARVTGLDASEAMLAIARRRVPTGTFMTGELEALPFADASFDAVTGFNSFQYAGNPGKALAEARRVTKPGGTVAIATWGPPEGMQAASLVAALRPLLPAPPPGAPGPFALSNEAALRGFRRSCRTQAGIRLRRGEPVDVCQPGGSDARAGIVGGGGACAQGVRERGSGPRSRRGAGRVSPARRHLPHSSSLSLPDCERLAAFPATSDRRSRRSRTRMKPREVCSADRVPRRPFRDPQNSIIPDIRPRHPGQLCGPREDSR